MATVTANYAAAATMTITYTSLATSTGWRESTAVDNTSFKYVDALVGGSLALGTVSVDGTVEFYAYACYDVANSKYTAGLTGTDATITWGSGNTGVNGYMDLVPLGVANVDSTDSNDDLEFGPFSVAAAFGGVLPPKWGVVVRNNTNGNLNATQTNSNMKYIGVKYDVA